MSYNLDFINIDTNDDIIYLIKRIQRGPAFAEAFIFKSEELKDKFFSALNILITDFKQKYFFYDGEKKLHISESERGYFWISTMGLIAQKGRVNTANNSFFNSCQVQHVVLSLLFDKAIGLCEDEKTYDVDGFNYGYLNELTPVSTLTPCSQISEKYSSVSIFPEASHRKHDSPQARTVEPFYPLPATPKSTDKTPANTQNKRLEIE